MADIAAADGQLLSCSARHESLIDFSGHAFATRLSLAGTM